MQEIEMIAPPPPPSVGIPRTTSEASAHVQHHIRVTASTLKP